MINTDSLSDEKKPAFNWCRSVPVIYQAEIAECGLACLAMVANFYGWETNLDNLRRRFPISIHGMNLKQLADRAEDMGLATRAVRLELDEVKDLGFPCIAHWGLNHFVVIKKVSGSSVYINDPAAGSIKVSLEKFGKYFTGVALELFPTENFNEGKDNNTISLRSFWNKIVGLKRTLFQVLLVSLVLQLFVLAAPFQMQLVVDKAIAIGNDSLLIPIAMGFLILLFLQAFIMGFRELMLVNLSSRLNIQMSANLFNHLISLPVDYFFRRHVGDVVSRFSSLSEIRHLLSSGIVAAIIDGLMALITLVAMSFYSFQLTLYVCAFVATYVVIRIIFYKPFKDLNHDLIAATAKENTHFLESIRGIQAIKIFQFETKRQGQWLNNLADVLNKNIKISQWGISYSILNMILFGVENIFIIYLAANMVMGDLLSLGMLYAFISYKMNFIGSVDNLVNHAIQFKMLDLHLERLADIVKTKKEPRIENNSEKKLVTGRVEVINLGFKFDNDSQYIFKGLNFSIEKGESTVIVGPSGCGKTTLVKCLMGLVAPTEGQILLDGKPIDAIPGYRAQIAAVMQDDQLLMGTIAENISFFEEQPNKEKIERVARMACVYDDIMNLPMGFSSLIGDMGASLSGGQKQRIILARALYREPEILFMDEATSHLDVMNEELINRHINSLNITRILVAHRPETIRSAGKQISLA